MRNVRLGQLLAAAAVIVAIPRHLVAQLFAAGIAAPRGPEWTAVVGVAAVAWAVLEAGTMFYLLSAYVIQPQRRLIVLLLAILGMIAGTNAPAVVADSAGRSMVDLLGDATAAHWLWAVSSIGATLLVVLAAGAADAAIAASPAARRSEIAGLVDAQDQLRNTVEALRAQPAVAPQPTAQAPQLAAGQVVNVTVTTDAPDRDARRANSSVDEQNDAEAIDPRERAVTLALLSGATTLAEVAGRSHLTTWQVRSTAAWRQRAQGGAE